MTGRARRGLAALLLGAAGLVLAAPAGADPARFVPWTDATTPPLVLNDLAGALHSVDEYRGRVVLVNFWATWCEPCRDEMASMQKLRTRLADRPFVVVLVNYGEARARVADFVRRESIAFPVLLDPNQDAVRAWRVRLLPSSFLIGPDGRVRYSVIGEIDWTHAAAAAVIQALLR